MSNSYSPSKDAQDASDYFNALPIEDRAKLAPLLEHYRQMGLAEAADHAQWALSNIRQAAVRSAGRRYVEPKRGPGA